MKKYILLFILIIVTFLVSCTQNTSFIVLQEKGYTVSLGINQEENETYEENLSYHQSLYINVSITDVYTVTDQQSDDFGYVYLLNDSDGSDLMFELKKNEAYLSAHMLFIYREGNYIYEMRHAYNSRFPQIFNNLSFEYSQHYEFFYIDNTIQPKILDEFISFGTEITLAEDRETFRWLFMQKENDHFITFFELFYYDFDHYINGYVYITNSEDEANILFYNIPTSFNFPETFRIIIKYQNMVFRLYSSFNFTSLPVIFKDKDIETISLFNLDWWNDV